MERIMELDFALREAISAGDGETASRLAGYHAEAVRDAMETVDTETRESLARQVSDLMAHNIKLAQSVRDTLRTELNAVMEQRRFATTTPDTPPTRSFTA